LKAEAVLVVNSKVVNMVSSIVGLVG